MKVSLLQCSLQDAADQWAQCLQIHETDLARRPEEIQCTQLIDELMSPSYTSSGCHSPVTTRPFGPELGVPIPVSMQDSKIQSDLAGTRSRDHPQKELWEQKIDRSFVCSYLDCISKSTGRRTCFRRHEHKTRHENTVHRTKIGDQRQCWVPGCKSGPFSRKDNYQTHLNLHGKRSKRQKLRYVASLDKQSNEYDPDWRGQLTAEGYPIARRMSVQ